MEILCSFNSDNQVSRMQLSLPSILGNVTLHHACKNGMCLAFWYVIKQNCEFTFFDIRELDIEDQELNNKIKVHSLEAVAAKLPDLKEIIEIGFTSKISESIEGLEKQVRPAR